MYFAGEYSKFEEGEVVTVKHESLPQPLRCTITNIGIIGGKLSKHDFLYHLVGEDGTKFDMVESNLIKYAEKS